jgi:hypothetical protein
MVVFFIGVSQPSTDLGAIISHNRVLSFSRAAHIFMPRPRKFRRADALVLGLAASMTEAAIIGGDADE